MIKWIVDRIEDDFLIVEDEDGEFYDIPMELIPEAQEGDIISIKITNSATKKKKKVKKKVNRLFDDTEPYTDGYEDEYNEEDDDDEGYY